MRLHSYDIDEAQNSAEELQRLIEAKKVDVIVEGSTNPVVWRPVNGVGDWTRLCLKGNVHHGYAVHVEFFDHCLQTMECFKVEQLQILD